MLTLMLAQIINVLLFGNYSQISIDTLLNSLNTLCCASWVSIPRPEECSRYQMKTIIFGDRWVKIKQTLINMSLRGQTITNNIRWSY